MRRIRVCLAVIILALSMFIPIQPALALPQMQIPFVTTPSFIFVNPQQAAALLIIETNTTHLAATDTEALVISFPQVKTAEMARPLFSPTIGQTCSETIAGDRCYLFTDVTSV